MNPTTSRRRWAPATAVLLLLIASCTGEPEQIPTITPTPDSTGTISTDAAKDAPPSATDTGCPPDVVSVVIGTLRCQQVTVPEQRTDSSRSGRISVRTLRLHITRITPPGGTRSPRPILVAGTNIGATPNYLGISPLAQRTGREVIIVDARGSGHSTPSLDCTDVHASAEAQLGTDSAGAAKAIDRAIGACAARLRASGTDVSAYGVTAMGADLLDVRTALGLNDIDVAAYGSTSLAVAEMMRFSPGGVGAVILDSPLLLGLVTHQEVHQTLPAVVTALLTECRHDPGCARQYLSDGESLDRARKVVAVRPLSISLPPRSGRPSTMVIGEERLLRLLRQTTSDGGSSGTAFTIGAVPKLIHDVTHRNQHSLNTWLSPVISSQEAFCLGRSPSCLVPRHHLAVGTWLTVACQTRPGLVAPHPTGPLAQLEVTDDTCKAWGVGRTSPELAAWSAPTLMAVGRYNTYQTPEALSTATGLSSATILEDPAAGSGVMARTECMLRTRDRWLDDPEVDPDGGCLTALAPTWE